LPIPGWAIGELDLGGLLLPSRVYATWEQTAVKKVISFRPNLLSSKFAKLGFFLLDLAFCRRFYGVKSVGHNSD
jgi:hypothetical protein